MSATEKVGGGRRRVVGRGMGASRGKWHRRRRCPGEPLAALAALAALPCSRDRQRQGGALALQGLCAGESARLPSSTATNGGANASRREIRWTSRPQDETRLVGSPEHCRARDWLRAARPCKGCKGKPTGSGHAVGEWEWEGGRESCGWKVQRRASIRHPQGTR